MVGAGVGSTAVIGVVVILIIKAITGTVGAVTASAGTVSAAPKPKPAGPKSAWNYNHNTGYGKTKLNQVSRSSINPDLL
jgi:hypothetical protein